MLRGKEESPPQTAWLCPALPHTASPGTHLASATPHVVSFPAPTSGWGLIKIRFLTHAQVLGSDRSLSQVGLDSADCYRNTPVTKRTWQLASTLSQGLCPPLTHPPPTWLAHVCLQAHLQLGLDSSSRKAHKLYPHQRVLGPKDSGVRQGVSPHTRLAH